MDDAASRLKLELFEIYRKPKTNKKGRRKLKEGRTKTIKHTEMEAMLSTLLFLSIIYIFKKKSLVFLYIYLRIWVGLFLLFYLFLS